MMEDGNHSAPNDWAPRKPNHEQARMEQRLYWSRKSFAERLAAMTDWRDAVRPGLAKSG